MKHIDIKAYLEAATASEDAWNMANEKLLELEEKLKEANVIKAQIKLLLDNVVSMGSSHLRSLVMDLENYYTCLCGKLENHPIHKIIDYEYKYKEGHPYSNAHEFKEEQKEEQKEEKCSFCDEIAEFCRDCAKEDH